jgi:hypothetical protein
VLDVRVKVRVKAEIRVRVGIRVRAGVTVRVTTYARQRNMGVGFFRVWKNGWAGLRGRGRPRQTVI